MSFTGVGVGLRGPNVEDALALPPGSLPFWEIAPENVVGRGGRRARGVRRILERDDVLSHGLAMSMGGFDPWDPAVMASLVDFLRWSGSPWHSEHLCFTSVDGSCTHELLPLPFQRETVRHTVARVKSFQAQLPVPFLLENISYYAELGHAEMSEKEFITEVLEGADCGWLLDINNVYVNSLNHGFDPKAWLEGMPLHRVKQMHIAGHLLDGEVVIDTHGEPVIDPVIDLMQWILPRIAGAQGGHRVPVLLERDNNVPPLGELLAEREKLQSAYDAAFVVREPARVVHGR